MKKWVPTADAYRLFHQAQLMLAQVEHNGVRVDKGYLDASLAATLARIEDVKAQIRSDKTYAVWRKRYGDRTNILSPEQLAGVVFGELGHTPRVDTEGNEWDADGDARASAGEKALEGIDLPIIPLYLQAQKLRRLHSTYLGGIARELVHHSDGDHYVHPNYNLNTVKTYRSSTDGPNWQNPYKRDPEFAEILRRCYIPRRGWQFVELDYVAAEVRIAACYTQDPVAVREIRENLDAHKDAACKLFFLKKHEVSKAVRNTAKGPFVFAQFYGDYYLACAKNIWGMIQTATVEGGTETILQRLAANGITELGDCVPTQRPRPGTFEAHVQKVEDWYWNQKYKVHTQWKKDWWEAYQRDGGCITKTGFAVHGPFTKNEIINNPIQGDSFHCLLWAMNRVQSALRKYKMRSLLVGEIHDCSNGDVPPGERDAYIDLSVRIMTEDIVKAWPWIVVPLAVETECCPIDKSWHDKAELVQTPAGRRPKDGPAWEAKYGPWELQEAA